MWDYLTPFQIIYEASKYSALETGFPSKYYALLLHPIWGGANPYIGSALFKEDCRLIDEIFKDGFWGRA